MKQTQLNDNVTKTIFQQYYRKHDIHLITKMSIIKIYMQCIQQVNIRFRLLRNEYDHFLLDTIPIKFICNNFSKSLHNASNVQIDAILFPLILRVVIL